MILRAGALAVLLLTAVSAQEPPALSIRCQGPVRAGNRLSLEFQGESRLPGRTILMSTLVRHFEHWETGRLRSRAASSEGFSSKVQPNGRFAGSSSVPAPGVYDCKVELFDHDQNPDVDKLTRNLPQKTWSFTFHAFDDAFVRGLEAGLTEIEELVDRARALLKDFEAATATEETWKAAQKDVEARLGKLKETAGGSSVRDAYPAALTEIHSTIEVAHQNLRYLAFKDGKFDGANDYHGGGQKVKTHRGDLYGHEAFRRAVEEAPAIAGRELCLWVIQDFRRSKGLRTEVAEMLQRVSKKPGVAEFAERLATLTAETADALEKDVRAAKLER